MSPSASPPSRPASELICAPTRRPKSILTFRRRRAWQRRRLPFFSSPGAPSGDTKWIQGSSQGIVDLEMSDRCKLQPVTDTNQHPHSHLSVEACRLWVSAPSQRPRKDALLEGETHPTTSRASRRSLIAIPVASGRSPDTPTTSSSSTRYNARSEKGVVALAILSRLSCRTNP